MPTYDMKNVKTGEVKEMVLTISKRQQLLDEGLWTQVHKPNTSPELISQHGSTLSKTSGDWKDLLKRHKAVSGRGCTINT